MLTEIDLDVEGNARFPHWPRNEFVETLRTHHDSGQGFGLQRATYQCQAPT